MGRVVDETNNRYGGLRVIKRIESSKGKEDTRSCDGLWWEKVSLKAFAKVEADRIKGVGHIR